MNAIRAIHPFRREGLWVFDQEALQVPTRAKTGGSYSSSRRAIPAQLTSTSIRAISLGQWKFRGAGRKSVA